MILSMGFSNPRARVLADVIEGAKTSDARWTGQHPEFSFALARTTDLDLYIRFAVHSRTFADTGPVTLSIYVNGDRIDQARFDTSGEKKYSHTVPSSLLERKNPAVVRIEVDPAWSPPDYGPKLGILLFDIGFEDHAK